MTSEPPHSPRRTRPDTAFRRRALDAPEVVESDESDESDEIDPFVHRESLREALSRIPDLDREVRRRAAATVAPEVAPDDAAGAGRRPAARAAVAVTTDEIWSRSAPTPGPPAELPALPQEPDGPARRGRAADAEPVASSSTSRADEPPRPRVRRTRTASPPRPPMWRRILFGLALVSLIGSIPVLASAGYDLVTGSTDGKEGKAGVKPGQPGYEELVTSTPTAVVVSTDASGKLAGLTFLALGPEGGGGTVLFLPLDTTIKAGFGINSLRTAYEVGNQPADDSAARAAYFVGYLLNVGIDEVIQIDDRGWGEVTGPVAPIPIDNLDPLDFDGVTLPAGPVDLAAEMVGPYLAKTILGEGELGRLARQDQFWRGWMTAVTTAGIPEPPTADGLGRFVKTLAAGTIDFVTLPGAPVAGAPGQPERFAPDAEAIRTLVTDAVPAPDPANPETRRSVRLLNGVESAPIPLELIRTVTAQEGSVTVVGNGPSFGRERTSISVNDPALEDYARELAEALGATGSVTVDPDAPDDIDVTVIFGRDLLGEAGSTPSTSSASEAPTASTPATTSTSTTSAFATPPTTAPSGFGT